MKFNIETGGQWYSSFSAGDKAGKSSFWLVWHRHSCRCLLEKHASAKARVPHATARTPRAA